MIITLKTLQQQTFKIEIDAESTVRVLKEKIENEKGADSFPAGGQKLIYAGKILDDEKPLSQYKIEEKNFVVVMVTKPKPATTAAPAAESSPAPAPSTPTPAPAAPVTETPKAEEKPAEPVAEKPASEAPSATSTTSSTDTASESQSATATDTSQSASSLSSEPSATSAESALVTGQAYEDVVSQMVNMGFPRDQVQRAMRASFNNPDRAVEYLFNGIPEMPREEPPDTASNPQATAPTATAPSSGSTAGSTPTASAQAPAPASGGGTGMLSGPPAGSRPAGEETLAFLRSQPQFQHMRTLIQQNPQLLPELLQQIGRSNPQLLQMISQNQEQFIAMLNEQGEESAQGGGGGGPGGAPGEGPLGSGGYIQVTQQEKEAIERLKALGFSEGMCIQAYFACEKNEELAANYLLSHGFEDEDS